MVNLILDTNTWIYLANGFNPITNKNEEESHFLMAEWMLKHIEKGECRIFSNYIIKLEWKRNKEKCNQLIKKYEAKIINEQNILKAKRKSLDYNQFSEYFRNIEKELNSKIDKNKSHIITIENILHNSIDIPISDSHKLNAVDLAIKKNRLFTIKTTV